MGWFSGLLVVFLQLLTVAMLKKHHDRVVEEIRQYVNELRDYRADKEQQQSASSQ